MRVIVLEGVNAAGKSLVGKLIKNAVQELERQCLVVDPAAFGPIGKLLRDRIVDPSFRENSELDAVLFAALRAEGAEHILQSVQTDASITLVLERWSLAIAAYGAADGTRPQLVTELRLVLNALLVVDHTFVLDVSGAAAIERLERTVKKNRFELRGKEYLNSVAQAYRTIAQREQRTTVIDASVSPSSVCEQLRQTLISLPEFKSLSFSGVVSDRDATQLDLGL
jgi:dTMP kinase